MTSSTSTVETELDDARVTDVRVTDDTVTFDLEDGRTVILPTTWIPRLVHATEQERANFEIHPTGVEWPDVEADISTRGVLLGRQSGESAESFDYWLQNRRQGRRVTFQDWWDAHKKAKANAVTSGT